MASPLEMYSKFVLAIRLCLAKNGKIDWKMTESSAIVTTFSYKLHAGWLLVMCDNDFTTGTSLLANFIVHMNN